MRKKSYHVLRFGGAFQPSPGMRRTLCAALILSLSVYAAGTVPDAGGKHTSTDGVFFVSDTVLSPPSSSRGLLEEAAEAVFAAAHNVPDDIIIEGYPVNSDQQYDIGGELSGGEASDIQQALPANVRLDRITVDAEVTKPLGSARVSSFFGFRKNPVTGKYTFHKGLDLAAPGGTEIHAMYDGAVTTASYDKGYGYYVIIEHGGFQTLYAHCSKLRCSAGDRVRAGEVIALVGSTGNSTGNHLHVEIRRDGQRYDPEWILGGFYS